MVRTCLFGVLAFVAIGLALFTVGCGGSTKDDAFTILTDFQKDNAAATKKYQGKTVRLSVEKVTLANKFTAKGTEYVTVQGQIGKNILLDVTVSDPAEKQKALALKIGEPAVFDGEPGNGMGEVRGMGAIFLNSGKVNP